MGYITKNLNKDEEILSDTKVHWIIFLNPFVIFSFILIATASLSPYGLHLLYFVLFAVGILWGLVTYYTTEFALTNKRVIKKVGFIQRNIQELKLEKIESVEMSQSIVGRFLNFGTIYCKGVGATNFVIYNVDKPLKFKNEISEMISN